MLMVSELSLKRRLLFNEGGSDPQLSCLLSVINVSAKMNRIQSFKMTAGRTMGVSRVLTG